MSTQDVVDELKALVDDPARETTDEEILKSRRDSLDNMTMWAIVEIYYSITHGMLDMFDMGILTFHRRFECAIEDAMLISHEGRNVQVVPIQRRF